MKRIFKLIMPMLLLILAIGCKKSYLETMPTTSPSEQQIFSTTDAVYAVLDGMYKTQYAFGSGGTTDHDDFGQKCVDLVADLMGNDMVVHSQGYGWFNGEYRYTAQATAVEGGRPDVTWYYYFGLIKQANKIMDNVPGAVGTDEDKKIIRGQALAMRADCLFHLINFFQHTYKGNESKPGVPIYLHDATDGAARGTVEDVYKQILADLTEAEPLIAGVPQASKARIDIHVLYGIRARVALQMEDYAGAASYANKARQGYSLMSTTQYGEGFSSASNPEWMWGSQISDEQSTVYASFFSHIDVTNVGYAALGGQKKITKALYDQIPAGDVRRSLFKKPGTGDSDNPDYNQLKFRVPTAGSWAADYVYMRVAEMYLIEAEGLARTGQEGPAIAVLEELIKSRYAAYVAPTGASLLPEILLQRRIELWGEGFAYFDIKRLKTGLNRPTGPGNHGSPNYTPGVITLPDQDPKFLMRIPQREIDANASMTASDQNP